MSAMPYDRRHALSALAAFKKATKLKEFPWEHAAGLGEGTLRRFRTGKTRSMSVETYEKLAAGASKLRGVEHTAAEIRGEVPVRRRVPIRSRIGAGELVIPIDGDSDLGWVESPPGVEAEECLQVDGDSMQPLYGPRDLLFPRPPRRPTELIGRIVAVQIRNGPRVVKQLARGSKPGRWNLVSVNRAHPTIEDCDIETAALIGAAIYHD